MRHSRGRVVGALWIAFAATAVSLAASPRTAAAQARRSGQLVISSDPAGAQISVDGRVVGFAPVMVPNLLPGDHLVTAVATNGARADQVANVVAGESHVVRITLAAPTTAPTPPASPPPTAVPQPSASAAPPTPATAPVAAPPPSSPAPTSTATISSPAPTAESAAPSTAPVNDTQTLNVTTIDGASAAPAAPNLFAQSSEPLVVHREREPIDADAFPGSQHMSAGVLLEGGSYFVRLGHRNGGLGGMGRLRLEFNPTPWFGVQLVTVFPFFVVGPGAVLSTPYITIGQRIGLQPRLAFNVLFGPGPAVIMGGDLELRGMFALTRHIALSAGLTMSLVFAGSRSVNDSYFGMFATGGFHWVL